MLPAASAMHFRIALSHVDRGIDRVQSIIVERHRTETMDHLILRVLAWCLFHDDELRFGPGVLARGAADLWAHDAAEKPTVWVECGEADADGLRKMIQHNRGVVVHVLFSDPVRRDAFLAELAACKRRPPEMETMGIWLVDPALVAALAASDARRQRWAVTVVGDHIYVEADGVTADGAVERSQPPPSERSWQ
jgi:uncharacterized protein YaeQ